MNEQILKNISENQLSLKQSIKSIKGGYIKIILSPGLDGKICIQDNFRNLICDIRQKTEISINIDQGWENILNFKVRGRFIENNTPFLPFSTNIFTPHNGITIVINPIIQADPIF